MPDVYSAQLPVRVRRSNEVGGQRQVKTWKQFARQVRASGHALLARLDDFPDAVLVSGCQRSGTTMLTRIIAQSEGMADFRFGRDDELDAALILSGRVGHVARGRYCFQTTYLNECYREYFEHGSRYRMIWVLRNPQSVVYSLVHHWSRFALGELFDACGAPLLSPPQQRRYRAWGNLAVNRLQRACLAYNGKTLQLFDIITRLGAERVMIVDYDQLVKEKARVLPRVYRFVDLPYKSAYAEKISARSLDKFQKLSERERRMIGQLCEPVYRRACSLQAQLSPEYVPPQATRAETQ